MTESELRAEIRRLAGDLHEMHLTAFAVERRMWAAENEVRRLQRLLRPTPAA